MIWRVVGIVTLACLVLAEASVRLARALSPSVHTPRWPWIAGFLVLDAILLAGMLERRAPIFGRIFWRGPTDRLVAALTFDDGPNEPYTSQVLDILANLGVKATFFVIGENAERFPAAVERAAREGHEVGNHTYDHHVLPLKGPRAIGEQIERTSSLIERLTGVRPLLFRTPHGWRSPWVNRVAREHAVRPVAWTLGVWDTDRPGADVIVQRTFAGMGNGCVLLLHDGRGTERDADSSQLVQALPSIIRGLQKRGYRLLTLSDLIRETEGVAP
jgi:peptidoglycan/xylan/chitin deacetylase (PgdA/CDA1 family)